MDSKPQFLVSFFDDAQSKSFVMWNKVPQESSSEKHIYESVLYKLSKNKAYYKKRLVTLFPSKICCYKEQNETNTQTEMDLHFLRCEFFFNDKSDHKHGIRFIKNSQISCLYTNDAFLYQEWKCHLENSCIKTDFHNKFNVLKLIGKGSFANVYLAERNKDFKQFAVKTFSKEIISKQELGKPSLINEINILKCLDHPNINKLEEIYESENNIYLILELLQGKELQEIIKKQEVKSEEEVKLLMKELLTAAVYLEKKKIMHRDLKPANIIYKENLANKPCISIVDFGLAAFQDADNYVYVKCGSPGYMAPEVFNATLANPNYTTKCDVFSCGIIFYTLLTGVMPFTAAKTEEILKLNKEGKINYGHPKLKKYKIDCIDLLKSMLEINAASRISAAKALDHRFFDTLLSEDIEIDEFPDEVIENYHNFPVMYASQTKSMNSNISFCGSITMQNHYITGNINSIENGSISGISSGKTIKNSNEKLSQLTKKLGSEETFGSKDSKQNYSNNQHNIGSGSSNKSSENSIKNGKNNNHLSDQLFDSVSSINLAEDEVMSGGSIEDKMKLISLKNSMKNSLFKNAKTRYSCDETKKKEREFNANECKDFEDKYKVNSIFKQSVKN